MTRSSRWTRREFLEKSGKATAAAATLPYLAGPTPRARGAFRAGGVRHILPSANHERFVIKVSFFEAQRSAPFLAVGRDRRVEGRQTDSDGEFFTFHVDRLAAGEEYALRLVDQSGRAITSRWPLRTFPAPNSSPKRFRLACITCPGGRDEFVDPRTNPPTPQFQPLRVKRRLLRRALDFSPDALHANGDSVYWDLRSFPSSIAQGQSPQAGEIAGYFDRTQPVRGTHNEQVLKRAFGPQIADLYGVDWRSVPAYFVIDDHDYTDNDQAAANLTVTFPPDDWMRGVTRTTQRFFYPELFTASGFPKSYELSKGLSQDFGVLRYGRLFEGLLYNAKGLMNNTRDPAQPDYNGVATQQGHPDSRLVPEAVERWLIRRTRQTNAAHYSHMCGTPILWTAGKFAEWYPDILTSGGTLTTAQDKPYWPDGWNDQHDRFVIAASKRRDRIPLWIQGDLHCSALGLMTSTRGNDLSKNPIVTLGVGTPGTGTPGFPSGFRGTTAEPSGTVTAREILEPLEENGFSLVDFTPREIKVSMFRWNHRSDPESAIDELEPFLVKRFRRPS